MKTKTRFNKLTAWLLTLAMLMTFIPSFTLTVSAAESYSYPTSNPTTTWSGSGTESDPYVITTAQQLADFAWFVNNKNSSYYSKYYKLGNDIDLSGGTWEPIGYYDGSNASQKASFTGTFDGNDKTVSGLNSVSTTHQSAALFGFLENGTIKNLTVSGTYSSAATRIAGICARSTGSFYNCTNNVNITISTSGGSGYAGGIAAYCTGNIESCQNNGNLTTDTTDAIYLGGICGSLGAPQKQIANCTNTGAIQGNGTNGTGGICATLNNSAALISNCTNSGNVSSKSYVGGIIGKANGKVEGCTNSGNVTASTDSAGGICGYNTNSSRSKGGIVNCSNSGTISAPKNIGGISGYGESLISKCYNTGTVKSTNTGSSAQVYVGGIEGLSYGAAINNCYNTGAVSGGSSTSWYVSGISGCLKSNATVSNCFNSGTISTGNSTYRKAIAYKSSGTITNCYFLSDKGTDSNATSKNSTAFSDGTVARLLQAENLELVWGQTIGTDTHPVFYNGSNALGVDATGIIVDPTTATVGVGKTVTLTATVTPEHANDKTVTWTSDNNSIATVVNGVVTGVSEGTATITVTTKDGEYAATCAVTVCDHAGSTHTEYTTANCQHTYTCTECNLTLTDACTFDAATGICSVCDAYVAVVSVTVNESTTHYKDIISAVEYVTNLSGSDAVEMKLTADSTSDATIFFPAKAITLDLNSKSATIRSLYYVSDADLTIKDSTSEQAGKLLITYQHSITEGAKLTLNSGFVEGNYQCNYVEGTFVMTGGTLKSTLNAIQVEDANSEIIISGGTLDGGQYAIYRQASYHTSKITLSGGYFIKGIRSTSLSGYPLSGLLAEGYKFVDDDNNNVDATVDYLQENLRVVFDHKHEWIYTANGNTITATCTNTDGACGDPEQSIKIEAPYSGRGGLVFNNAVKAATISGTIEDVVLPEIVYTLKSTGEVATPIAPGVYVASLTLGTATARCEFEITKATLSYSYFTYSAPANLTYDGTPKVATVVPQDGYASYIGEVEVLYGGNITPPINVGSYVVTINVAESDYYFGESNLSLGGRGGKQFSIVAKDIEDLTYTGLTASYPMGATPDVTIQYNGMTLVKDTDYTIEYANNTTPGGTATMTVKGIGNYAGTKTLEFKISEHTHSWNYELVGTDTIKATCTAEGCTDNDGGSVTIAAPASLDYTGKAIEAVVTNNLVDTTVAVNAVYTAASGSVVPEGKPVKVGTYTASITLGDATAEVTFEIKPAPVVTGIDFNRTSPAYDAATNTFYVSDDFPFELTVTGEYLTMLENAGGLEATFFGDTQNAGGTIMGMTIDSDTSAYGSYNIGSLAYAINTAGGGATYIDGIKVGGKQLDVKLKYAQLFTLTINSSENGSVKHDHTLGNEIPEDVEVTLKVSLNTGYELETLIVDGQNVTTQVSDGKYKFTMPANDVEVSATFKALPHTHDWEFAVNGNVITATCEGTLGVCPNPTSTITLVAPENLVYNGSEKVVTTSGTIDGVTIPDVQYEGNRVNAGTFTAKLTIDNATATLAVTITPKSLDGAVIVLDNNANLGYTGNAITPDVTSVTLDGTTLVKDTDYTVSYSDNTNAGQATVTVTGKGNYKDTANTNFTIEKATPVVTAPTAKAGLTYTGQAQELVNAGSTTGGTMQYSIDNVTYSADIPTVTNAGTYTVYYKVAGGNNYNDVAASSVEVTIDKQTVNKPTIESKEYTGTELTADVLTNELYTVSQDPKTDVGEYDVTITLTDAVNYKWADTENASVTLKFNITAVTNSWKTEPSISGWTFGQTASTPSYEAKFGTVKVEYKKAEESAYTTTVPTNAGNYTARFSVAATNNYGALEKAVDFTITKAQAVISVDTTPIEKFYGEALTLPEATSNIGSVTVDKTVAQMKDNGTYTVTYTVAGTNNYDGDTKTVNVTIKQLPVNITWENAEDLVYDNTEKKITAVLANKVAGDNVNLTVEGVTSATEKGTYTATVTAVDNDNYTITNGTNLTKEWAISETANEWTSALSITGWTFGDNANAPTATAKFGTVEFTYADSIDGAYSDTVPTNAGTYYVKATVAGTSSYAEISATAQFIIEAKELNANNITAIETETYTGEEIKPVLEVKDGDTTLVLGTDYEVTYQNNVNAGTAKAIVTFKGNYKGNAEKEFTILKKQIDPAITLTAPVKNTAPQTEITGTGYTATVVWSPDVTDKFGYNTEYTATITITVDENHTVTGIAANGYTVEGAKTVTNDENSNVVTVAYEKTGSRPSSGGGTTRYTVKFDTDDGSNVASKTVTRNSKVAEPTAPTKDGFTFAGWYTEKELTTAYDFDTKVTKSFTLYAKWNEIPTEDDNKPGTPGHNCPSLKFSDLDITQWYHLDTDYVIENDIFRGTTESTFTPNGNITRAMMITVLYRAEGEPEVTGETTFEDIDENAYYAKAVVWGQQNGIIKGYSETEYAPEQDILREQIAAIMHRHAQYKGYDVSVGENTNILSYDDFDSISEYAIPSMQWAVGSGMIKGRTESTLNPDAFATRVEIAAMLHRFIEANK